MLIYQSIYYTYLYICFCHLLSPSGSSANATKKLVEDPPVPNRLLPNKLWPAFPCELHFLGKSWKWKITCQPPVQGISISMIVPLPPSSTYFKRVIVVSLSNILMLR